MRLDGWASFLSRKHTGRDWLIDSSVPPDPHSWKFQPWSVAPVASGLLDTLQWGGGPCGRPELLILWPRAEEREERSH